MIQMKKWNGDKAERKRLKELYFQSFPKEERVPFWLLSYKAKRDENNWVSLYDGDVFIGLIYTALYRDIVYIWYFAFLPKMQGSGYGSLVLQKLHDHYRDKRIILNIEIDDPTSENNDLRKRRKQFYLRNGYEECGFYTKEAGVVFEMLSYGGVIQYSEFESFMSHYFGRLICALFLKRAKNREKK